jgi:signal transduction histidine kinase
MSDPSKTADEMRVLVLAPTGADAALSRRLLTEAGFACHVCTDLAGLSRDLEAGAGAVLLTEAVLDADDSRCLVEALQRQPAWSDVPILLLADAGADSSRAVWAMELLGNITLLERPVRVTTLISALRTALKARRRQYELRNHMEALRRQNERLRLLWEAAAVLFSAENPDAMLQALFGKISKLLGLDCYFNFVVNEAGDALELASCAGIPEQGVHALRRLEFGQAICGTVALERRPVVATHIQQSTEPLVQLVKSFGIRAYACNPLLFGDRLLGTLSFATRGRDEFPQDELEFLQTISRYVTMAYERLRLINQLREADRRKDDFLALLAHELRNPLAPIRNSLQVLRLRGPDEPEVLWGQAVIERQVVHLTRLIDDLLDISRITRDKLELRKQWVGLAEVLQGALESSRPLIEQQGHRLEVRLPEEPVYLHGDLIRLAQVFMNLLTNAAKYTRPGGHIRLLAERRGDRLTVRIKDTGIGIPADKLPHLFEMFFQVDRTLEQAQGGLGIGLALVRRLVELHGGSVEARSDGPGQGSEFLVHLPIPAGPVEAAPPPEPGGKGTARLLGRRILVVDDNQDAADSLALLLQLTGNEVHTAHDGLEAVEAALRFRPDVVLLDLGMPKLNGYDACRRIRAQPGGKDMWLVALTGWGQEEDRRRSHEAGFNGHLVKPVDPAALEKLLADLPPK